MRALLLLDERSEVAILLDTLIAVEAAQVLRHGDQGRFGVDDAHALVRCDDGEGPLHVRVRDAVVVLVEADIRSLSDAHLEALFDRKFIRGDGDHRRPVLDECRFDGLVLLVGHAPLAGNSRRTTRVLAR